MIDWNRHSNFVAAFAGAGMLAGVGTAAGSTIITSNLSGGAVESAMVCASTGDPLPGGSRGLLGAFPGMTDEQIVNLLNSAGRYALLGSFLQIGEPFAVGQGSAGEGGYFEVSAHESLSAVGGMSEARGEAPFIILFNAPEFWNATEILVLKLADVAFPTDPDIGLETYLAVHLRGAEAVVGTRDAVGFLASKFPPGETVAFADWIIARLGAGAPAANLLPLADPDQDGLTNLAEFGMGLDPGKAEMIGDLPTPSITDGDTLEFVFEYRTNAVGLVVTVERSDTLNGPWTVTDLPFVPAGSEGLPLGIERAAVDLPMAGKRESFARLRFELVE